MVRRGQAAIEMVIAVIGAGVLFVGILAVWSWLIGAIVERSRNYDKSRVPAATPTPATAGETSTLSPKKMSVWGD